MCSVGNYVTDVFSIPEAHNPLPCGCDRGISLSRPMDLPIPSVSYAVDAFLSEVYIASMTTDKLISAKQIWMLGEAGDCCSIFVRTSVMRTTKSTWPNQRPGKRHPSTVPANSFAHIHRRRLRKSLKRKEREEETWSDAVEVHTMKKTRKFSADPFLKISQAYRMTRPKQSGLSTSGDGIWSSTIWAAASKVPSTIPPQLRTLNKNGIKKLQASSI